VQRKKRLCTHKSFLGKYIQSESLFPLSNHSASSQLYCLVIAGLSCIYRIVKISFESYEFSIFDIN